MNNKVLISTTKRAHNDYKMGVSQRTVEGYRENTFDKLNVKSRTGIVLFAFHAGIVSQRRS